MVPAMSESQRVGEQKIRRYVVVCLCLLNLASPCFGSRINAPVATTEKSSEGQFADLALIDSKVKFKTKDSSADSEIDRKILGVLELSC